MPFKRAHFLWLMVWWRFDGCVFRSAWGWLGERKKCQQTHQIWEGFFSDSLYVLFIITGYNGYRLRSRSRRSYGILRLHWLSNQISSSSRNDWTQIEPSYVGPDSDSKPKLDYTITDANATWLASSNIPLGHIRKEGRGRQQGDRQTFKSVCARVE